MPVLFLRATQNRHGGRRYGRASKSGSPVVRALVRRLTDQSGLASLESGLSPRLLRGSGFAARTPPPRNPLFRKREARNQFFKFVAGSGYQLCTARPISE